MATFAFTDAFVSVDGTDLSNDVRQVSISFSTDELDDTAMGDTYRSRIGGLNDVSVSLEFNQDFASSQVDATLFPLLGTVVTVIVRPDSGSVSATNPNYTGDVLVNDYTPMGNSVGDLATVSVTWPGSGSWSRATS